MKTITQATDGTVFLRDDGIPAPIRLDYTDKVVIQAYAENNMSAKGAARQLDVYWNFVYRRLDKIWDKTGLNPQNFFDLCKLMQELKKEDIVVQEFKKAPTPRGRPKGSKKPRELKRKYSVYEHGTDRPICISGTAEECAEAMGITYGSFRGYIKRIHLDCPIKKYDIYIHGDEEELEA